LTFKKEANYILFTVWRWINKIVKIIVLPSSIVWSAKVILTECQHAYPSSLSTHYITSTRNNW